MLGLLLTLLLIVLLLYSFVKWRVMRDYWTKKGIPQDRVHPLFGSLTFLQKKNPVIWLRDLYNSHNGAPYVGIWLFWRKGLIINCPDISRCILLKDSAIFNNRFLSSGKNDPMGALNLFTVDDPLWSAIRRRLTTVYTSYKIRGQKQLFDNKNNDLIYRINYENERKNPINLRTIFADYATDIIGESAFGIKCEATRNSSGPLREMTKEFEKYGVWRGIGMSSIFFFPELVDFFGFTFWPKHTNEYFIKIFKMVVGERGGYMKETDGKRDLLDTLIKLKQDSVKDNQDLPENVIISNALIFLQGGYDTSSAALSFAVYELAYNQEAQKKAYDELMAAKEKLGGKNLDSEDLCSLIYFNACLKEGFRKYPPMGWLDRVASRNYQIDDKLTISAGTVVYINATGMHQDPKYFPEPEQFKPERWLPENAATLVPYTYLPFGDGPRSCIGKRFGQNTVRNALASILQNFEIRPLPNMPLPNDVEIERRGLFLVPGEVLNVDFVPRA